MANRGHIFPHLDPAGQYEQFKRRIERFQYVFNSSSRKLFVHITWSLAAAACAKGEAVEGTRRIFSALLQRTTNFEIVHLHLRLAAAFGNASAPCGKFKQSSAYRDYHVYKNARAECLIVELRGTVSKSAK